MRRVIDFGEMSWCDLLTKDEISDSLPRCYGFPDECGECETSHIMKDFDNKYILERLKKQMARI